jgi:excisionase family DNA binding protein
MKGNGDHRLKTWTVKQAAEESNLPLKTLYKLLGTGALASYRIGRSRRISPDDLEQFLESCREEQAS